MRLENLIKNCKKGDLQAQELLYRKFSRQLFGLCLKYAPSKAEAEDCLHDSFITIFEKIGQYKGKGSFEGWMKRITVNTVLQKYRNEASLTVVSENLEATVEVSTSNFSEINLDTLLKAIQGLPHRYRLTFNLYVLDGYSHKEIGKMLSISEGTSKSNLARARILLKKKLEKENYTINHNSVQNGEE